MPSLRQLAIEIFILVSIGAVLGLLGPFNTFILPLGLRLIYWIGVVLVGYAIYRPVQTVAKWLSSETAIPLWVSLAIAAALASLPQTFVVGFVFSGMRYDEVSGMEFNPAILGDAFVPLYLQVFGIGVAVLLAMHLTFGRQDEAAEDEAGEQPPESTAPKPLSINELPQPETPSAPFFNRLPARLGHNLVCLEMQDHYVNAHTLVGSEMILMRLRDAIAELDGVEGMQVHRSWWVARDQVRAVRREGRGIRLELANGLLAPVSRARQADLKREGWL